MAPLPVYQHFIDGKFVDSADHYDIRYPYTDEKFASVARAGASEMEAAIASATRPWLPFFCPLPWNGMLTLRHQGGPPMWAKPTPPERVRG